jgi:molybdate transport system substrate-binding protein
MKAFLSLGTGLLATTLLTAPAMAVEVVSPAVTIPALTDFAKTFQGPKVNLQTTELLNVKKTAEAKPNDLAFATPDLLDAMKDDIAPGSIVKVGRANVVLAVRKGSPHPDISTVAKFIAALKSAKNVVHSDLDPARGSLAAKLVDALLKRPEFAGVHHSTSQHINGVGGLMAGEGDMALQFAAEVLTTDGAEVVGVVPAELGAYADLAVGRMANAPDAAGAKAFTAYITRPEAAAVWKARGLEPVQ